MFVRFSQKGIMEQWNAGIMGVGKMGNQVFAEHLLILN